MGFIGKKELYTILCTGIGDYSSDSLELNVDITPDFVVRNIDKYNFVYKIEVVDGSTLIREFGFPKLESEVVSVITPTWIFEHENNTLKITGSSKSLPDISDANIGDVLTVGENGAEWSAPSGGLPDTSDANVGDVLTIGNDGAEWAAPAGGGGLVVGGTWSVVDGAPYLTLNKTALELRTAVYAGISPILVVEVDENVSDSYQIIANFGTMRYVGGADYSFSIGFGFEYYVASSDNAYPHTQMSG